MQPSRAGKIVDSSLRKRLARPTPEGNLPGAMETRPTTTAQPVPVPRLFKAAVAPVQAFFKLEASSGILLALCAVAAMSLGQLPLGRQLHRPVRRPPGPRHGRRPLPLHPP